MDLKVTQICPKCQGFGSYEASSDAGTSIVDPCLTCMGEGKIELLEIDTRKIKQRFDDIDDDLKAIKQNLGI